MGTECNHWFIWNSTKAKKPFELFLFLLLLNHFFLLNLSRLCLLPPGGAAPSDRSASGLLEWESINDAMEALAMMNHYQMKNASRCQTSMLWPSRRVTNSFPVINGCSVLSAGPYPYTLKLCFSTVQHANWSCACIQEGNMVTSFPCLFLRRQLLCDWPGGRLYCFWGFFCYRKS